MKPSIFILSLIMLSCQANGQQTIRTLEMGELPKSISESSGLAVASENTIWTHNDSGGDAEVYEIDIHGELIRTVKLQGVTPKDMEDMAQDEKGNLYLADTGNNERKRERFLVYKFNVADIKASSVTPEVIEFVLPDNGIKDKCHYDIESMIWLDGKLYFFTKDRCDKPDNKLIIYAVSDEAGLQNAENKGEFFWEDSEKAIKITGADTSKDGKKLALLSKDAIHFFFGYKKDRFFSGVYRYVPLKKSQKEGIVHLNDCDVYFTDEADGKKPGKLWKINLCQIDFD